MDAPIPRLPRGRPKGSRNVKGQAAARMAPPPAPETRPTPMLPPAFLPGDPDDTTDAPKDAASLLEYHRRALLVLDKDLDRIRNSSDCLPRDIAMLTQARGRELQAIARLSGAERLTEAKIFSSDVWLSLKRLIVETLADHPDAVRDLNERLRVRTERAEGAA
jgi:hypothetical protein